MVMRLAGDGVPLHVHGVEVYRKAGKPSDETDAQQTVVVGCFARRKDCVGKADALSLKIEGEVERVCPFGRKGRGRKHLCGRTGVETEKVGGAFVRSWEAHALGRQVEIRPCGAFGWLRLGKCQSVCKKFDPADATQFVEPEDGIVGPGLKLRKKFVLHESRPRGSE